MSPIRKEDLSAPLEVRLGRRIKAMRALRGMTQKELADACEMSNQTLSRLENGKTDFQLSILKQIERVLECTLILVANEDII